MNDLNKMIEDYRSNQKMLSEICQKLFKDLHNICVEEDDFEGVKMIISGFLDYMVDCHSKIPALVINGKITKKATNLIENWKHLQTIYELYSPKDKTDNADGGK